MESHCLEVINLYKHSIIYKKYEKKKSYELFIIILIFSLLTGLAFSFNFMFDHYKVTLKETISYIYNPVYLLYSDLGHIIFTSGEINELFNVEKDIEMLVPLNCRDIEINEHDITFNVESNVMIMAAAEGVILQVGMSENNQKFIEIKHTKSIITRYENVDIAGVVPGEVVKSGQDIATAKPGSIVKFTILKGGKAINNLKIVQNKIVWQN